MKTRSSLADILGVALENAEPGVIDGAGSPEAAEELPSTPAVSETPDAAGASVPEGTEELAAAGVETAVDDSAPPSTGEAGGEVAADVGGEAAAEEVADVEVSEEEQAAELETAGTEEVVDLSPEEADAALAAVEEDTAAAAEEVAADAEDMGDLEEAAGEATEVEAGLESIANSLSAFAAKNKGLTPEVLAIANIAVESYTSRIPGLTVKRISLESANGIVLEDSLSVSGVKAAAAKAGQVAKNIIAKIVAFLREMAARIFTRLGRLQTANQAIATAAKALKGNQGTGSLKGGAYGKLVLGGKVDPARAVQTMTTAIQGANKLVVAHVSYCNKLTGLANQHLAQPTPESTAEFLKAVRSIEGAHVVKTQANGFRADTNQNFVELKTGEIPGGGVFTYSVASGKGIFGSARAEFSDLAEAPAGDVKPFFGQGIVALATANAQLIGALRPGTNALARAADGLQKASERLAKQNVPSEAARVLSNAAQASTALSKLYTHGAAVASAATQFAIDSGKAAGLQGLKQDVQNVKDAGKAAGQAVKDGAQKAGEAVKGAPLMAAAAAKTAPGAAKAAAAKAGSAVAGAARSAGQAVQNGASRAAGAARAAVGK